MSFVRKYNENTKVWLMSDLHLGHSKEFLFKPRGFESIEEHNEQILKNIKECVEENDEFYILGDLTLGDLDAAAPLLRQIPGHVHVILGNHDTDRRIEFYQSLGWDIQFATRIKWKKYSFYLSHYPTDTANPGEDFLSQVTINVFGHTHSPAPWTKDRRFSYNVCPEANACYPVEISDIIESLRIWNTMLNAGIGVEELSKKFSSIAMDATSVGHALKALSQQMEQYNSQNLDEEIGFSYEGLQALD